MLLNIILKLNGDNLFFIYFTMTINKFEGDSISYKKLFTQGPMVYIYT